MLNNNESENNNPPPKLEENIKNFKVSFVDELRKKYSQDDIMNYFDLITETKIMGWENKFLESNLPFHDCSKVSDPDILNEDCQDEKILRLINGDIERTRVQESIYMDSFKDYVFKFIIYFINQNNITYKQGLNEIIGPFILLKHKLELSLSRIYKLFVCFVDKFLTNYFIESEFFSLESTFSLINLLLRYHDTVLFHRFEHSLIFPELYATPWIITMFSNKCSLNVTYYLWDRLILFDDNLFLLFFITALLIINKDKFFGIDNSIVLSVLSQLHFETIEEVNEIINFATEIKDKTPQSFYILANKLEIFKYNSKNLKILYEKYKPEKMLALPIFPNELFCIMDFVGCPDENCENFLISKKFNDLSKCIFCRNKEVMKEISYIIFDLRIFENENEKISSETFPGFLPKTLRITNEELRDPSFPKNILDKYENDKDKFQFILITSETEYFEKYEKEFYKYKGRRKSKTGDFYKRNKEIDIEKIKEKFITKGEGKKEYLLLKEYDNFKKIIQEMNNKGFKYVSYVFGGYKDIHKSAIKNKIILLEHGKKCILCKEKNDENSIFKFW